ncbi:MAG: alpha/beta hydrolase [Thalassotalea sp.]
MAINRLEVSNANYVADNTQLLTIHSSYLNRRHDVSIYNVNASKKNTPIIILMHGVYGNHWVWMGLGGIHKVYDALRAEHQIDDFILVMPSDGGLFDGSAYLPTLAHGNYEQWIMDDVVKAVIQTVPTANEESNLYLSGLSMGGYGALRLGVKYPNQVKGISAHSSITQLHELNKFTETHLEHYQCENEQEHDILYWAQKHKSSLPPLRFDCGKDDILYQGNLTFKAALEKAEVNFSFDAFDGEHAWAYWHEHIVQTFMFFNGIENSNQNR